MKKSFKCGLIVLLFLLPFCSFSKAALYITPPDTACDVITLTNGKLIYCRVKKIGNKVVKYAPCGGSKDSIKEIDRLSVFMINNSKGELVKLATLPNDSLHKPRKLRLHDPVIELSFSCGLSSPTGVYGSSAYDITDNQTGGGVFCGFASPGFNAKAMLNLIIWKGWELTGMIDYVHSGFNATGFLNENPNNSGGSGIYNVYDATATGSYYYNNYAFFGGITKKFGNTGPSTVSFRFLVGEFELNIPSPQGIAYLNYNHTGGTVNVSLPGVQQLDNGMDLGTTIGIRILPFMYGVFNADFIFAGGGGSQPFGSYHNTYDPNVAMFNFTLGVRFEP